VNIWLDILGELNRRREWERGTRKGRWRDRPIFVQSMQLGTLEIGVQNFDFRWESSWLIFLDLRHESRHVALPNWGPEDCEEKADNRARD